MDRIDFIMFSVANEKQRLSVALIMQDASCNIRLQHVSVIMHFHWKLIKLRYEKRRKK